MTALLQLRDGPIVRQDAVDLALRLEAAGHGLSVANGVLTVTNGSKLSAEDRAAISALRLALVGLIGYCQEGHEPR